MPATRPSARQGAVVTRAGLGEAAAAAARDAGRTRRAAAGGRRAARDVPPEAPPCCAEVSRVERDARVLGRGAGGGRPEGLDRQHARGERRLAGGARLVGALQVGDLDRVARLDGLGVGRALDMDRALVRAAELDLHRRLDRVLGDVGRAVHDGLRELHRQVVTAAVLLGVDLDRGGRLLVADGRLAGVRDLRPPCR